MNIIIAFGLIVLLIYLINVKSKLNSSVKPLAKGSNKPPSPLNALFTNEIGDGLDFFFSCHSVLQDKEFVIIDFETATRQKLSVISLGITSFDKGNCLTREYYFKPYKTKTFEFTHLHGITPEMVADKPRFHELWDEIKPLLHNKLIIAHNIDFDLPILYNLIDKMCDDKEFNCTYLCTLELSRNWMKKWVSRHGLENLCGFFDIPYGKHNGARDTISTLMVLNKLFYEYPENYVKLNRAIKGKKVTGSYAAMPRMVNVGININE